MGQNGTVYCMNNLEWIYLVQEPDQYPELHIPMIWGETLGR